MAKEGNMKRNIIIAVILIIIVIIGIATFFIVKCHINNVDKSYELETISEEDCKYFAVYAGGKFGVIDISGNMIIKNEYANIIIPNQKRPVFICYDAQGQITVLNENSEQIYTEYETVEAIEINGIASNFPYEKSVLRYKQNGLYGLIDFSGNVITKPIYQEIYSVKYKEGELLANKDGKYGVINNKGVELISFEYDDIEADKFYDTNTHSKNAGYIVKKTTSEGYKYGYVNSNWETILNAEYTSVSRILDIDSKDVYLIVAKEGQFGVFRNKNKQVDFLYQSIDYNKDTNLFIVERSGKFGVINTEGKIIVDIIYKYVRFNGIYIYTESYTEKFYFDKNGEKVENGYTNLIDVSNQDCYITINENNLYGMINRDGEEIVKNQYLYIEYVFDNYFVAYKEGNGFGVIDKNNNVIVQFGYDVLSKMGEYKMLKGIKMDKNITDIFSSDMEKIASAKDGAIDINEEYLELYNAEKSEYITKEGDIKTAQEIYKNNTLFAIPKDKKWGAVDINGEEKLKFNYEYITQINNFGFAGIKQNGKWGAIDKEGNIVCECIYDFDDQDLEEGIIRPEFLGKYYKTYTENGEIYYSDEMATN